MDPGNFDRYLNAMKVFYQKKLSDDEEDSMKNIILNQNIPFQSYNSDEYTLINNPLIPLYTKD